MLRAICEYEGWIVPTYPSDDGSGEVPALAMLRVHGRTLVPLLLCRVLQSHHFKATITMKHHL